MTSDDSATARPRNGRRQQPVRDEGQRSLAYLYPDLAAQWDRVKNTLTPEQVTPGSNRGIWWLCENGHSWLAAPCTRKKGAWLQGL